MAWINSEHPLESPGKVIRIVEPEFFSHFLDHALGVLKQIRCMVHPEMLEILIRRFTPKALKQAAKVRMIYVAGIGDISQGAEFDEIFLDEFLAALVGYKGRCSELPVRH